MKFIKYRKLYLRKVSRIDSLLHNCTYSLPFKMFAEDNRELFTKITFSGKHLSKCVSTLSHAKRLNV